MSVDNRPVQAGPPWTVTRLADYREDEAAAAVLDLPWPELSGNWAVPVTETWVRHVVPGLHLSLMSSPDERSWRRWLERPGSRDLFRTLVRDRLAQCRQRLAARIGEDGTVRLLGVVSSFEDPAAELRDGTLGASRAFWSWDLEQDGRLFTTARFTGIRKEGEDWYVVADFTEEDVDWSATMMMLTGFGDFEKLIQVRPEASPRRVVSVAAGRPV